MRINTLQKFFKNNTHRHKMSIFTQKLNPITAQFDWVVQNEDYDFHQEVARSSYADMLHDHERNQKYEAALKVAIDHLHSIGKKAHVLDIGTGTGLLSMLAARHGADSVVACEAFVPMSQCAIKIIELNGFSDKIKVVPKRSTDLVIRDDGDLQRKANILVTEVFDTELIGEGAINTFQHAHEKLLEENCIVIPHSAIMYAQVVESPLIHDWNKLKDIYNQEGEILLRATECINECPGGIAVHDIQMSQLPLEKFNKITSPQKILHFDWTNKTPFLCKRQKTTTCKIEKNGVAQAVLMWWELIMDIENKITLSCAPYWDHPDYKKNGDRNIPWRDHWMQAVYYLPREVKAWKDEEVSLISCHDEFSLWFNLRKQSTVAETDYETPFCYCNLHYYPRTRIGQLNDTVRTKKYVSLLERHIAKDSIVLVLSHGFYHSLIAAKLGARRIVCIEPNTSSRSLMKSFVEYNNLTGVEIINSIEDLENIEESDEENKFNIVIGEPSFSSSILPWDNLLFMFLLKAFKKFCTHNVQVFPKQCVIKGMAVEFSDLHKIRAPLGKCENFDMAPFDELIQASSSITDENVEAQPLWEYPCKALSQPVTIATIDMESKGELLETTGEFNLESRATCNGVTVWVDWILDEKCTVSTGPIAPVEVGESVKWDMHVRQGVQLINKHDLQGQINYTFTFDYNAGNISFKLC